MDRTDEMLAVFADLLSDPLCEEALARVFSGQKNTWQPLRTICEASPDLRRRVDSLTEGRSSGPHVVWLEDPLALEREGYCVVVCYWDEEGAESVAPYNKAALDRRLAERRARLTLLQ